MVRLLDIEFIYFNFYLGLISFTLNMFLDWLLSLNFDGICRFCHLRRDVDFLKFMD